jgi:hypothetical protein
MTTIAEERITTQPKRQEEEIAMDKARKKHEQKWQRRGEQGQLKGIYDNSRVDPSGQDQACHGMIMQNNHRNATHHPSQVCCLSLFLHGDCSVELKKMEKKKVPTSHKAICFSCIDRIQAGCLLKLDKSNGNWFISLGQYKVHKLFWSEYPPIKLIDPVPFDDLDETSSDNNSDKSSDNAIIEVVDKPATTTPANNQQTNTNNATQKKTEDLSK